MILVVDQDVTTLLDYHHSPHRKATDGAPGAGDHRSGKDGQDLVLPVPDGTVVLDKQGNVLADLVGQGTTFVAAQGGLGNATLASALRKAPGFALLGVPGDERRQFLADLGALRREAEDRGLPVHEAGPEPATKPLEDPASVQTRAYSHPGS